MSGALSPSIFKAYDIRGIVDGDPSKVTLTEAAVRGVGAALGLRARAAGIPAIVVGRDGRLSGPRLIEALTAGIVSAGVDTIDIGMVPTPVVYYATVLTGTGSGIAVTGSHNPPEYNGMKMMLGGATLYGEDIQSLYREIVDPGFAARFAGIAPGRVTKRDVSADYLQRVLGDVKLSRPMKVAIDAGNGVAGALAPQLFRGLGCELVELFTEVDGTFPNHHPDPAHPENLEDLIRTLRETDCEIGLAFDGDGDRLGVVTKSGHIVWPDRQLMLYAQDVLAQRPGGQIIYDVKCTRNLAPWIRRHGGQPLMWRTGHSLIKAKLKETKAPLAGEMSGHVFFNDRWYGFDDGLYTGARLLEILSRHADPGAVLEGLPDSPATPELHIRTAEGENFRLIEALQKEARFDGASEVITIDGVRVEYPDGFGLARASNTTPVVVTRFEADSPEALARIQRAFGEAIRGVAPKAQIPF
ncbi:MAG TPA: phosphomannomutase/phosphoglucomutase [Burkholderiaceae bacterium]|nr:phosphomannomutase/phosphoglucomutase [Burkholderiaceae bacterium]